VDNFFAWIKREDDQGQSMFHRAATDHNWDIIEEVYEPCKEEEKRWIDEFLNKTSHTNGDTPLIIACMSWRKGGEAETQAKAFINNLLNKNVDVNKCNHHTLWTALHWASFHGDFETVTELLKRGASPAMPDNHGYFPMDLAGRFGHNKIVKLLIKKSLELTNDYSNKLKAQLAIS
jgi:ankyrin repeat protein